MGVTDPFSCSRVLLVPHPIVEKVRVKKLGKRKVKVGNFQKQKSQGSYNYNIFNKSKAGGARVGQFSKIKIWWS